MKTEYLKAMDVKISYPNQLYQEIMHYVNKSDFEVSGFCLATYSDTLSSYVARNCYILEQENSKGETEMSAQAVNDFFQEIEDEEYDCIVWWHSHVQMQVFWSPTDMDAIELLSEHGPCISTVFNQKHEHKSAYAEPSSVAGYKNQIFLDDIVTGFHTDIDSDLIAAWDVKYQNKVKNKEYKSMFPQSSLNQQDWSGWGAYSLQQAPYQQYVNKHRGSILQKVKQFYGLSDEDFKQLKSLGDWELYNEYMDMEEMIEQHKQEGALHETGLPNKASGSNPA
jgi:proteasome lid subunit RPN8/RPN11